MRKALLALAAPVLAVGVIGCKGSGAPQTTATAAPTTSTVATTPSGTSSAAPSASAAQATARQTDSIDTSAGPLVVTPIHHGTLLLDFGGKHIYLDPFSEGNFDGLPKADFVFVTDIHPDHLDEKGLAAVQGDKTTLVGPPAVNDKHKMDVVLANGDKHDFGAFSVEAIPMYNTKPDPQSGKIFHDKGRGDGFVFTFGDKRVYVSGDTACTPEMKALKSIDVAFVCMNLPYTMPPSEAAECVKAFKPKIVYPYHYRGSDTGEFKTDVSSVPGIDVRLRNWY